MFNRGRAFLCSLSSTIPVAPEKARLDRAFWWPFAAGLGHGLLSLVLAVGGYQPSSPSPLGPAHYAMQALFAPMLFPALWWVYGSVAHFVLRALGAKTERNVTLCALAPAYALPWLFALVLPELILLLLGGFELIGRTFLLLAPLTATAELCLGLVALRAAAPLSVQRATLAVLAGLVVQALAGANLVR